MHIATTPTGWIHQTTTPAPHINAVPTLHQCHKKMHNDYGDAICGKYFESKQALLMHQKGPKEHKNIFREASFVKSNTCPLCDAAGHIGRTFHASHALFCHVTAGHLGEVISPTAVPALRALGLEVCTHDGCGGWGSAAD